MSDGVFPDRIVLGTHFDLNGPLREYVDVLRAAEAFFAHINEAGGVHGRHIEMIVDDDGCDSQKAVVAMRRQVEDIGIFSKFLSLGGPTNLATQDYLDHVSVPAFFL